MEGPGNVCNLIQSDCLPGWLERRLRVFGAYYSAATKSLRMSQVFSVIFSLHCYKSKGLRTLLRERFTRLSQVAQSNADKEVRLEVCFSHCHWLCSYSLKRSSMCGKIKYVDIRALILVGGEELPLRTPCTRAPLGLITLCRPASLAFLHRISRSILTHVDFSAAQTFYQIFTSSTDLARSCFSI